MTKTKVIFFPVKDNTNFDDIFNKLTTYDIDEILIDKENLSSIEYMNLVTHINENFSQSKISPLKPARKKIIQYKTTYYDIGRIRLD